MFTNAFQQQNESLDPITGVLERSSFLETLNNIISNKPLPEKYVFGIANIEQFKLINYSHGNQAGDHALKAVAKTLSLEFDKDSIIGRIGNAEFGFICKSDNVYKIQSSCESLNYSLSYSPIIWNEKKIRLHIKFGLVYINDEVENCDQILRHANEAIFTAQYDGCNTVCEYKEENTAILRRSSNLQKATTLQRYIARDQFLLYVQPIVHLNNHKKASYFEILLRGITSQGKIIQPGELIEAAEDFNLTPMLDKWVIRNLFKWIKDAGDSISSQYKFSFNLSALSINDNELTDYIIKLTEREKINPRKVNIEVTERVAISNLKRCYDFMTTLKQAGFTFSLDDFGSGYCSFKYIQTLPFDVIKIDGSFIKDIDTNKQNRTIAKAITDIANAYERKTVAEYIENENVANIAKEIGIDFGQGYYFSKPFSIEKLSS